MLRLDKDEISRDFHALYIFRRKPTTNIQQPADAKTSTNPSKPQSQI